jgi:aromatic-L-amino-acid decarboxylase
MKPYPPARPAPPGGSASETDVLRWLADLFGLPAGSTGQVTAGATMAALSAVVAARSAMLPDDFLTGTIYVTEQTHASVARAARIAGFPPAAIRTVTTDANFRMDPDALRGAVLADGSWGTRPFYVVAAAGTTDTGVVDPLPEIADIAEAHRLWLHVDAAHGGFFHLTDRGRRQLRGIGRADSVTADVYPRGTGVLLVRDGIDVPGLDPPAPGPGRRLWLPVHPHGVDAFRADLDGRLDLAADVYRRLVADPRFAVPVAPQLSTVVFRLRHGDTADLVRRVDAEHRGLLSGARVNGRYTGLIRVADHRTDRTRVDGAVAALHRHAAALGAGR